MEAIQRGYCKGGYARLARCRYKDENGHGYAGTICNREMGPDRLTDLEMLRLFKFNAEDEAVFLWLHTLNFALNNSGIQLTRENILKD